MSIPRYERERQNIASRRFTRGLVRLYLVAAVIGLIVGVIWVTAGLLKFHPLW
jgi:hypothetical protein